ncbi:hypothetical protein FT663_04538 [Candidozyma haemuli var. vulneris]|nr:hypothetical protein FT662_04584 [[Candida] haemuloni var. vulneris]KAF3987231.1 hypothetical protein FT663_04538 [[Candida] haemuloni var. vulneris]
MAQTVGLLTLCAASFLTGYVVHGWFASPPKVRKVRPSKPPSSDSDASTESYSDSDSEDDIEIDSRPLNEIPGEVRMTLIVRSDLKMGKGKAAAQCSHATLALYKRMADASKGSYNPTLLQRWERGNGQAKITLQVPNQEDMDVMFAQALSLGVNAYIVHDAGRTQIAAGSATVLGLGPAPKLVMDQITSDLKLY